MPDRPSGFFLPFTSAYNGNMKRILGMLQTFIKAAIFFTMFAFALNNQDDVTVRFFFGAQWHSPLVLVVLASFALGLALGVLAMVPKWWRERRAAQKVVRQQPSSNATDHGN